MQRYQTPSQTRAPKHPDNYCFLCVRDRKPDASTHFLRQCPQLPQKERDLWTRVFDKTLQTRSQPRNTCPEKIEGQTVSVSLMNMVEDFYDLSPVQDGENQLTDYFGEEPEHGLADDYMALQEDLLKGSSNIAARSVKCKPPKGKACSCNCDQSCKKNRTITNRRICFSSRQRTPNKRTHTR